MRDPAIPSVPIPCCGMKPYYEAVFKKEYKGLAHELRCSKCGHIAASPVLASAINAWNINLTRMKQ